MIKKKIYLITLELLRKKLQNSIKKIVFKSKIIINKKINILQNVKN